MDWDHKPEQISDLRFDISENEEEKDEEEEAATKLERQAGKVRVTLFGLDCQK